MTMDWKIYACDQATSWAGAVGWLGSLFLVTFLICFYVYTLKRE